MLKRAVLFANGEMPDKKLIQPFLNPDDVYIAVDGGLRHLRGLGKTPALLIGDLDSLTAAEVEEAEAQGVEVRRFKVDKDETDLELALLAAAEMEVQEIVVIAALGGRLDHTLANLSLLALPQLEGIRVTFENGTEEVFLIRREAEIKGSAGEIVSLVPCFGAAVGVETRDLKYPLRRETLLPERSRGISNVMLKDSAGVRLESGLLICIHTRCGEMNPRQSGTEEK